MSPDNHCIELVFPTEIVPLGDMLVFGCVSVWKMNVQYLSLWIRTDTCPSLNQVLNDISGFPLSSVGTFKPLPTKAGVLAWGSCTLWGYGRLRKSPFSSPSCAGYLDDELNGSWADQWHDTTPWIQRGIVIIYIYPEPVCPLFWASTLQTKAISNKNKGVILGSGYPWNWWIWGATSWHKRPYPQSSDTT